MVAFLTMLMFNSCKKENDSTRPVIVYELPEENVIISVGDSVRIRAVISDENVVNSVKVSIVNDASVPVTTPAYFYPGIREFVLDILYPVDNFDLTSGVYNILTTASDGPNAKNKYLPVQIRESETKIQNYILIKQLNSFTTKIEILQRDFTLDSAFIISKSYALSDVSSQFGLFYFSKNTPSRLQALNTFNFIEEWEREAATPYPQFLFSEVSDFLYISSGNGAISGYNQTGDKIFQTDPMEGYIPRVFHVSGDYIVSEQFARNGQKIFLVIYYVSSGFERNRFTITDEVAAISSSEDLFILFLNDGQDGIVKSLKADELIYTELRKLENTVFIDALKINENIFLITTNKGIFEYEVYLNRFTFFKDLVPDVLRYDDQSGLLYATNNMELIMINYYTGEESTIHESADKILNFHIVYNK